MQLLDLEGNPTDQGNDGQSMLFAYIMMFFAYIMMFFASKTLAS